MPFLTYKKIRVGHQFFQADVIDRKYIIDVQGFAYRKYL